jgi:hypothetical protein
MNSPLLCHGVGSAKLVIRVAVPGDAQSVAATLRQLSNIHSIAPRSSRVASGRALGKPHLSIVTRYQPSVFCKPETAIEAVCGPVASFENIPKFIGDHGEGHYSSPTLC